MTGELSQIIALITYGNAYISKSHNISSINENTAFQYCKCISFTSIYKRFFFSGETMVAENPKAWLQFLKAGKCLEMRLAYAPSDNPQIPDHISAAFVGGGGEWLINCNYERYSEYWKAYWTVTDRDDPDRKIWTVRYFKHPKKFDRFDLSKTNLSDLCKRLTSVLVRIRDFANEQQLATWANIFSKALEIIRDGNEVNTANNEIINRYYSLTAKQIFYAADRAWVFGGMGSWNDLYFEKPEVQEEYSKISYELYSIINEVLMKTVNTFYESN